MFKKIITTSLVLLSIITLTSCSSLFEREHFGVKESVWDTLSEESKQIAIAGYNDRAQRQQEIDAEQAKRQQEIDAQNAPYEYALKIVQAKNEKQSPCQIKRLNTSFGEVTLENGERYKVECYDDIENWKVGHVLFVGKSDSIFYDHLLANCTLGEQAAARKR